MFVANMFGMERVTLMPKTSPLGNRRERPAKPALSREGIIDCALKILHAEGLAKVTMRRIAGELDTGAASLYVYIQNTEDLHAQILDALLASVVPIAAATGTWRDRLKQALSNYMKVLFDHPEIARMAMSTLPSGPNYLSLVEALLGLLKEGEVADRDAAWAVDLLLLYATANAAEHSAWQSSPKAAGNFSALSTAISHADPLVYPHVARLGSELMSGGPERGAWALDVLINGVLGTPRPLN